MLKKHQELLLTDFWMIMTLEKLSTRKLELELDKLLCKEVDLQPDIGKPHQQRKRVLFKKKMTDHGTQPSLEKFLKLALNMLLKLLPQKTLKKLQESLQIDF
jgi:hypothetical protein